jgi:two-component system chemotaxis response regulator CheY
MNLALRFLVVDDFWPSRRIIGELLRSLGYTQIAEADSGAAALQLLRSGAYDVLLTDWDMPGMSGVELIRQVRSDASLAGLPALLFTAGNHLQETARLGVSACIVKPFTADMLDAKLRQLLATPPA